MKSTRTYATAAVALALLAGCAGEVPEAPTTAPTTTQAEDPPTTDAETVDPYSDEAEPPPLPDEAPYVDPDGNPLTEEDVDYMYEGDLGWGETYGLMQTIWDEADAEMQDELCGARYELGEQEAFDLIQDSVWEHQDWELDPYAVYDFFQDNC